MALAVQENWLKNSQFFGWRPPCVYKDNKRTVVDAVTIVHRIIYYDLNMRRMCVKFLTRMPSDEHNEWRVGDCREMIDEHRNCQMSSRQSRPCFLWLWLDYKLKEKFKGSSFEDIEKMKESVTRVPDVFPLDVIHGAFTKGLEFYKDIKVRGFYFEGN